MVVVAAPGVSTVALVSHFSQEGGGGGGTRLRLRLVVMNITVFIFTFRRRGLAGHSLRVIGEWPQLSAVARPLDVA